MPFHPAPGRLLAAAALALATAAGADQAPEPALLNGWTIRADADGVTIRIDLSDARQPRFGELKSPYRAYFDFPNTRVRSGQTLDQAVNHKLLTRVRAGQFAQEPPVARLVLEMPAKTGIRVATAEGGKVLFLGLGEGAGRPARPDPPRPGLQVTRTAWSEQEQRLATLVVELTAPAETRSFYLGQPDRIVIDIDGAELRAAAVQPGPRNGLVDAVRLSQFEPDVVRCVLDLKQAAGHLVLKRLNPHRLEIRVSRGEIRDRLVVVDAGHGGKDPGCQGYRPGLKEKDVVLDVAQRVAALLTGKGVRVELTRADDTFVPLSERAAIANNLRADLFVSIHCNAMPDDKRGTRSGCETYWHNDRSETFATIMLGEFAQATGLNPRGVHQRRFVVVRETVMPAVLVETAYLDHPGDGARLDTPDFRQQCAVGIVHGVMSFLQRMPNERAPAEAGTDMAARPLEGS